MSHGLSAIAEFIMYLTGFIHGISVVMLLLPELFFVMLCDSQNCSFLQLTKAFSTSPTLSGKRYQTLRVTDILSTPRFTHIDFLKCRAHESLPLP